jgi:hypothetical protein
VPPLRVKGAALDLRRRAWAALSGLMRKDCRGPPETSGFAPPDGMTRHGSGSLRRARVAAYAVAEVG